MVCKLLIDLVRLPNPERFEIVLTKNIEEQLPFPLSDLPFRIQIVDNSKPKGFGANHNAAFRRATGEWFCVMNPDIRLEEDPFPELVAELEQYGGAVVAPVTLSVAGLCEDSIRRFPTPWSLAMKAAGVDEGLYPCVLGGNTFPADWVGGMFMLFRTTDFRKIGGFDEGFFLYYEDVDICVRLWKANRKVLACPRAQVIHVAQRASRRELRYMRWHVCSMARYFAKHWLRLPATDKRT